MDAPRTSMADRIAGWMSILVALLALGALLVVIQLYTTELRVARGYQDTVIKLVNDYNALAERTGQPERVRYLYARDGIVVEPLRVTPTPVPPPVRTTGDASDVLFEQPTPAPTK